MATKSNKQEVETYIRGVLSGKIPAGKLLKAACQRHLDDLKRATKKGIYFDEGLANRAIDFFPLLTLSTGEYNKQPFMLKPFQKFIVWCLFGWRRAIDGMRRYRRAFISMGKGNGKSPFAAGILLLCFAFDSPIEARAECYVLATKKKQTTQVFGEVRRFIKANDELRGLIQEFKDNLSIAADESKLEPLGCEGSADDGQVPHCVVVDELHRFMEHHRPTWNVLQMAMQKRRQPLLLVITTAGDDKSLLWVEQYNVAVQVVERGNGVEADDLFVFICEIDKKDDPLDERVWPKANPMLEHGVVKIEGLRNSANLAKIDPKHLHDHTRFACNRRVTSRNKVVTSEMWGSGNRGLPDFTDAMCHAGFDWGWKNDLAALAYAFPLDPIEVEGALKRRVAVQVDIWIPENGTRNLAMEPWAGWIRDRWLRVTHGKITDTESIYATLAERQREFGIRTIACDPNNCREFGSRVQTQLGIPAFWFGQTCGKYNEPVSELLAMLHEGRLIHGGNPVLAWAAMNMILKRDAKGYVMPDKERSEEKIDPIVAVIMAISEVMFAEQAVVHSYYDDNDVEAC